MQSGAASIVIDPPVGSPIQGASVDNVASHLRDHLEANALYLEANGTQVLLVSCDLVALRTDYVAEVRRAMAAAAGLSEREVILTCTHQHSGPVVVWTNPTKPVDEAYHAQLSGWLVELARRAREAAVPARLGWGQGVARIGYNRRCCWADGSHSMHGDGARPDFTGLEGPDDPTHTALFAEDFAGNLLAVLHHNTTHPTCFYGRDFFSADFPGAARAYLREVFGNIPVLYLNGAFGDISIGSQTTPRAKGGEAAMLRAAHLVAGETLRLHHETPLAADLTLCHICEDVPIKLQMPTPERLAWARQTQARLADGEQLSTWDRMFAHGIVRLNDDFGATASEPLAVHAIRLGELAIVTQPCELFCQFGLDIKRRSPAQATIVVGVADGYAGYCPTLYGALGGGYSGEPLWWTRLAPEAGYRLVDAACRLLRT